MAENPTRLLTGTDSLAGTDDGRVLLADVSKRTGLRVLNPTAPKSQARTVPTAVEIHAHLIYENWQGLAVRWSNFGADTVLSPEQQVTLHLIRLIARLSRVVGAYRIRSSG
jgi:hypothetical protein